MLGSLLLAVVVLPGQAPKHKVLSFSYAFTSQTQRYSATIARSGKGTFNGEKYEPRPGKWTARYPKDDFWKLDQTLEKLAFWGLSAQKSWGSSHAGAIDVVIVSDQGRKKLSILVENETAEHWAIRSLLQSMIDGMIDFRKAPVTKRGSRYNPAASSQRSSRN